MVGGSSDGQDEQSRIVLPPEAREQPSLSSGLSAAPWLNRRRPGSLYSIIEYDVLQLLHYFLLNRLFSMKMLLLNSLFSMKMLIRLFKQ